MSTNFFDQNDEGEFRDVPDEVVEGAQAPPVEVQRAARPITPARPQAQAHYEEEMDYTHEDVSSVDDDEDDYSSVLSDARLRLEQGRLYEMIMNHDLFEGLDSDPAAIKHVQKQIRRFAKEQMEIMLGMRRETTKVDRLEIDFPFNQLEVDILRKLASAASKGASERSDRFVPEVKRITEEVPVVGRKEGLNRIAKAAPVKATPVKATPQPATRKPLPTAPAKPMSRKQLTRTEAQILAEEQVSMEALEPDYKPLEKPIHEMTEDEIIERNRQSSLRRQKQAKSSNAMPMPTESQESLFQQTRVLETAGSSNAISTILALMNQPK